MEGPGGLDPLWADDPRFDVGRHVHALSLPAPGTPAQLRELAGTLLSARLDRAKPLWNLYLVLGREGGFAIVGQAHHTLVDGIAAVEVGMLLLDAAADAPASRPVDWRPAPPPVLAELAGRTLQERALGGLWWRPPPPSGPRARPGSRRARPARRATPRARCCGRPIPRPRTRR